MVSVDVTTFNKFVQLQIDALETREELKRCNGIPFQKILFNEFNTYFKHKMYDYKKGQDLTEDDKIMKMTENNYKSLVRAGEFKACT